MQTSSTNVSPRQYFTLNTGAKIPAIGFGTWKAAPGDAGRAVEKALGKGYRHFVRFHCAGTSTFFARKVLLFLFPGNRSFVSYLWAWG